MARCEVCFDPKPFFVLEGRYDGRSHVGPQPPYSMTSPA
jgi:hypothetical protein